MDLTEIEDKTLPINMETNSANVSQFQSSMESTIDSTDGVSGVGHKTGYVSPLRARTMKEYEQQISDLHKENFNLKLRLYFLEEKMEKNFDVDTRQLHETNIQLKIEAEHLRKDIELKEKLLQEARDNVRIVEEKFLKEFNEWKNIFLKEHNYLEEQKETNFALTYKNAENDESLNKLCKEAFGPYSTSSSQSQTDTSEYNEIINRDTLLQEAVTTLQRLDKVHQEEINDLREMTREKKSSLDSYVAKLKQQMDQMQLSSFDSKNSTSSSGNNVDNEFCKDSESNSKEKSDLYTKETTDAETVVEVKRNGSTEKCMTCGTNIEKLLDKELQVMKQQCIKRDKTIQGLTEIVYKKEKELKRVQSKQSNVDHVNQLLKLAMQAINIASTSSENDKIHTSANEFFVAVRKYISTVHIKNNVEISEDVTKSLERHILHWLTGIQDRSNVVDSLSEETISANTIQELNSLHQAVKDKNVFIQELLTERKNAATENNKSMENLLTSLKQKDLLIQELQSKLDELQYQTSEQNIVVQLKNDISKSESRIEELTKTQEKLINENRQLKETSTETRRNLENILKQKEIELQNISVSYEEYRNKIEKLERQLNEKAELIIKYQNEQSELKEMCHVAQQDKISNGLNYEKQIQILKEKLESAKTEIEKIKQDNKNLNKNLQNIIEEKDNEIEVRNKSYKELENEFVKINTWLLEEKNACSQLKHELKVLTQNFSQVQQEKQKINDELEGTKLELRDCEKICTEKKEKEIEDLKMLLQDKMLMAEALNVELQLKESIVDQLEEDLNDDLKNRKSSLINWKDVKKLSSQSEYPLNFQAIANLKRYSLPTQLQNANEKSNFTSRYFKLMSQNLSNFGHSDDILQLKEEICALILKIEWLEHQIQEGNEENGSKMSLLSGVSEVFSDSVMNRTTKTWTILHAHIEELADFLECLLHFDSNGQLDTSLITQKNVARLKKYLTDSKELSQSLSASLLGGDISVIDGTLDMEPSKDVEKLKELLKLEKTADEKTGMENLFKTDSKSQIYISNCSSHLQSFSYKENCKFIADQDVPYFNKTTHSSTSHSNVSIDNINYKPIKSVCFDNQLYIYHQDGTDKSLQVCKDNNVIEPNLLQHSLSSDSDVWSEPDRTVSKQRMGVKDVLQTTSHKAVSSKSPTGKSNTDGYSSKETAISRKFKNMKQTGPIFNVRLKTQVAECHAALQDKVLECHNLAQTKEVLEKELSECQDELASCREMLEELKTQLEEKDKEYQKLLKSKEQVEIQQKSNNEFSEEIQKKLIKLSNIVESMQTKLSEEEKKVVTISSEKSDLMQKLENKIQESRQIQDWNLRLQKEIEEGEQKLKMNNQLNEQLNNKIITLNNVIGNLETKLAEEGKKVFTISAEKSDLLQQLKGKIQESIQIQDHNLELQKEIEEKEENVKINRQLNEQLNNQIIILNNVIENLETKLAEEEKKLLIISTEKSDLSQQLKNKVQENRKIQDHNLELENKIKEKETICKSYQETKNQLIYLQQNWNQMQQNYTHIQKELERHITSEHNLLKEKALLETGISCKEKQITNLEESYKNLQKELQEKQSIFSKQMNILQAEKSSLQEKVQETEEKLVEINNFCIALKSQLQNQDDTNQCSSSKEELLIEMHQLRKELARNVSSNKKLRHKMEKLQNIDKTQVTDFTAYLNEEFDYKHEKPVRLVDNSHHTSGLIQASNDSLEKNTQTSKLKDELHDHVKNLNLSNVVSKDFPVDITTNQEIPESHFSVQQRTRKDSLHTYQTSSSTEDSKEQRSHFTSPDLGIESDLTHDFGIQNLVQEACESNVSYDYININNTLPDINNVDRHHKQEIPDFSTVSDGYEESLNNENSQAQTVDWTNHILCAVSQLQSYELLKKEIEESLILTKGMQARVKDCLTTISAKSSPIKGLEYSTLKEIGTSCTNMEAYLEEAWNLIGSFWITTMPQKHKELTENKTDLSKQNLLLMEELALLKMQLANKMKELKDSKEKIEAAQSRKEKMERAITHQLTKTRKVLKEAKGNLKESTQKKPSQPSTKHKSSHYK